MLPNAEDVAAVVRALDEARAEVERLRPFEQQVMVRYTKADEQIKTLTAEVERLRAEKADWMAAATTHAQTIGIVDEKRQQAEARLREVVEALTVASMRLDMIGWELEKPGVSRNMVARLAHTERDAARAALAAQPEHEACEWHSRQGLSECNCAAAQPSKAKCDGDHGGPRCADPECWNDE